MEEWDVFLEMKGVIEIMERKGYTPDKITLRTMMKAYSIKGMGKHVKELRDIFEKNEKLDLDIS